MCHGSFKMSLCEWVKYCVVDAAGWSINVESVWFHCFMLSSQAREMFLNVSDFSFT